MQPLGNIIALPHSFYKLGNNSLELTGIQNLDILLFILSPIIVDAQFEISMCQCHMHVLGV